MNWFSFLFITTLNPLSAKNAFQTKLFHALSLAKIEYHQSHFQYSNHQIELQVSSDHHQPTKVIFSTQKNPYWQVTALQQLQKTATLKGQQISLINLGINHPYVTLKNN